MSYRAVEEYAELFENPPQTLQRYIEPMVLLDTGAQEVAPIDLHTLKDTDRIRDSLLVTGAAQYVRDIGKTTLTAVREAGEVPKDIGEPERNSFLHFEKTQMARMISGKLIPKAMKTGKIQHLSLEMVTADELPDNVAGKLAKPNTARGHGPDLSSYDTLHRMVAQVKVGGRVGVLAVGVSVGAYVSDAFNYIGVRRQDVLRRSVESTAYPKTELTAEKLHEATIASARRQELISKINANRG